MDMYMIQNAMLLHDETYWYIESVASRTEPSLQNGTHTYTNTDRPRCPNMRRLLCTLPPGQACLLVRLFPPPSLLVVAQIM